RLAVAQYAVVLLEQGRVREALEWARRAERVPAEDVRSRVVSARVLARALAAVGDMEQATIVADEAVRLAHATEQVSERPAADVVRRRIARAAETGVGGSGPAHPRPLCATVWPTNASDNVPVLAA